MEKEQLFGVIYSAVPYNIGNTILTDEDREFIAQAIFNELNKNIPVIICNHFNQTNYCNTDGSFSHRQCDDCLEWIDV